MLFDRNLQIRQETCYADTESCLLGINKNKLAVMQKELLEKSKQKDYSVIESVLKGNYLLKSNWRKEMMNGNPNPSGMYIPEENSFIQTPPGSIR